MSTNNDDSPPRDASGRPLGLGPNIDPGFIFDPPTTDFIRLPKGPGGWKASEGTNGEDYKREVAHQKELLTHEGIVTGVVFKDQPMNAIERMQQDEYHPINMFPSIYEHYKLEISEDNRMTVISKVRKLYQNLALLGHLHQLRQMENHYYYALYERSVNIPFVTIPDNPGNSNIVYVSITKLDKELVNFQTVIEREGGVEYLDDIDRQVAEAVAEGGFPQNRDTRGSGEKVGEGQGQQGGQEEEDMITPEPWQQRKTRSSTRPNVDEAEEEDKDAEDAEDTEDEEEEEEDETDVKDNTCRDCDQKFTLARNLKRHMDQYRGVKLIKCSNCNGNVHGADHLPAHRKQKRCFDKKRKFSAVDEEDELESFRADSPEAPETIRSKAQRKTLITTHKQSTVKAKSLFVKPEPKEASANIETTSSASSSDLPDLTPDSHSFITLTKQGAWWDKISKACGVGSGSQSEEVRGKMIEALKENWPDFSLKGLDSFMGSNGKLSHSSLDQFLIASEVVPFAPFVKLASQLTRDRLAGKLMTLSHTKVMGGPHTGAKDLKLALERYIKSGGIAGGSGKVIAPPKVQRPLTVANSSSPHAPAQAGSTSIAQAETNLKRARASLAEVKAEVKEAEATYLVLGQKIKDLKEKKLKAERLEKLYVKKLEVAKDEVDLGVVPMDED